MKHRAGRRSTLESRRLAGRPGPKRLRFFLGFAGLWSVLTLVAFHQPAFLTWLCLAHVEALRFLLALLGMETGVQGLTMVLPSGYPLVMVPECTAVFIIIVYLAGVLAYPTTAAWKAKGVLVGVPVLVALNLVRLVILAVVQVRVPGLFAFVHSYLWHAVFIAVVLLMLRLWTEGTVEHERPVGVSA